MHISQEPLCKTAEYILYRCSHTVGMDKVKKNIYQLRLKQIFTICNTPDKKERKQKELSTERELVQEEIRTSKMVSMNWSMKW